MSELVGSTVSQFRIDRLLGRGGMGAVYLAYDLREDREVALKLMHPAMATQRENQLRLQQEAKVVMGLNHPSIVKVHNFGVSAEGQFYVAMEHVPDGSIREHLERVRYQGSQLDILLALQIGIQIAEALEYAHLNGVIHRDVKPENIILRRLERPDEAGFAPFRAVLTDFGLLTYMEPQSEALTPPEVTLGTPTYMSPEQSRGVDRLTSASDVYSLAVVVYEMLASEAPMRFSNLNEAVAFHYSGRSFAPVTSRRANAPAVLDEILARATAADPLDRYVTAGAFAQALQEAFLRVRDNPTQGWHARRFATEEIPPEQRPPEGQSLLIYTDGKKEPARVSLRDAAVALGRDGTNKIILDDDQISRQHATLTYTAAGWVIQSLAGAKSTFFNGRSLRTDEGTVIKSGERVRLGPYELVLEEAAKPTETPTVEDGQQTTEQINQLTNQPPTTPATPPKKGSVQDIIRTERFAPVEKPKRFGINLGRDHISIDPGQTSELLVELHNKSDQEDYLRLKLDGIPPEWVKDMPRGSTKVKAGEIAQIPIIISPPKKSDVVAGDRPLKVSVLSKNYPDDIATTVGKVAIAPFVSFLASSTKESQTHSLPETVTVEIKNQGNQTEIFRVLGRDPDNLITIQGEEGAIELEPNQSANVGLRLDWNGRPPSNIEFPYEIEVKSSSGATQLIQSAAVSKPSPWVNYLLGAILFFSVLACGLIFLTYFFGNRQPRTAIVPPPTNPVATVLSPTDITNTPISGVGGETAGQLTAVPTEPRTDVDSDNDGLQDNQEIRAGSRPDNPDTDSDRLLDGEEVLEFGTDPTLLDSDSDGISDYDEIYSYGTNPNIPDSDNDGVNDGAELQAGTDPNVGNFPTEVPTEIPSPTNIPPTETVDATETAAPTATPAPTQTPIVVTATPPPTPNVITVTQAVTVVVTETPTITPEPSETPDTPTSTPVPTDQPTEEPTTPPTDTPTETPIPTQTFTPIADTPTPDPTETTVPTETVAPSPTPTEEATATPEPTPSETPTQAPTPTLAPTDVPISGILLACAVSPPTIDGSVSPAEAWQDVGLLTQPSDPNRGVEIHITKDATYLYLALSVVDPSQQSTDEIRIFLNTDASGGLPTFVDRRWLIKNDGTVTQQFGNGESWDDSVDISELVYAVNNSGTGNWSAEIRIPRSALHDLSADGGKFTMMADAWFSNGNSAWPDGTVTNDSGTWQLFDNGSGCVQ